LPNKISRTLVIKNQGHLMFIKSILLHLRIPFSFLLMPVYVFALSISPNLLVSQLLWSFIIIHLFVYPASNAFNSYFDKDEKSIGLLKNPPPVNIGLYYTALFLDSLAVILGYVKINLLFALMLLIYILVSRAYSHPLIRLKKYPVGSWAIAGFFQGFFSFLMSYIGINKFELENLERMPILTAALLTSLVLWASYPMTQIYQHEEDTKHGDTTLSMKLGIRGTFYFAMIFFAIASVAFVLYFNTFYELRYGFAFLLVMAPVVLFFLYWFNKVWKDESQANFSNTMWLNFISALCLNGFFFWLFLQISHVGQF